MRIFKDIPYVENGHKEQKLTIYLPDEGAGLCHRHVILTNVNPLRINFYSQLHVVIDNERHPHAAQIGLQGKHLLLLLLVR